MNTDRMYHDLSPQDYAALTDAAKLRAVALRRAAGDAFWKGLGDRARAAAGALRRVVAVRRAGDRVQA